MKIALGEFEEIVLLLVAAQHDQAYGHSITKAIGEKLNRPVTMSSVHTSLYRLEEKGFVHSKVGGATSARGGRRKRFFVITTAGMNALQESRASRNMLWQLVPNFLMQ